MKMNTRGPVRSSRKIKGLGNQERCGQVFVCEPRVVWDPLCGLESCPTQEGREGMGERDANHSPWPVPPSCLPMDCCPC